MRRAILESVLLVMCLSASSRLSAQDTASVAIGAPLRVRTDTTGKWHYGRFGGVAGDSLLLVRGHKQPDKYQVSTLGRVELRYSPPGARSKHIANGAVAGALGGVLLLHLAVRHCEATSHHSEGPPCAIGYAGLPVGIGVGALAGAFVGAAWPTRAWRRVAVIGPFHHEPAKPNGR
jgi:hypothetical protein